MICPNCNNETSFHDERCEHCNTDLSITRRLVSWSNIYYNEGLTKARARDLSGAIESLKRSLKFYKYNTEARNLLGLIYYEMGECTDALCEWVISTNYKTGRNKAVQYVKEVQSDATNLDRISRNIKKYNTSLGYAQTGDYDLAVIQLKKLHSENPKYIQAGLLLALLYIRGGRKEGRVKAYKILRGILEIDKSNTQALTYIKELNDVRDKARARSRARQEETNKVDTKPKNTNTVIEDESVRVIVPYEEEKPMVLPVLQVLGGVLFGILIMAFVVQPAINKYKSQNSNGQFVEYSENKAAVDSETNSLREENADLSKKVEELEAEVADLQGGNPTDIANYKKMYENLIEAKQLFEEGSYRSSAKKLKKVDVKQLDSKKASKFYESFKDDAFLKASESYTLEGTDAYNGVNDYAAGHDYEVAMNLLNKALMFNEENTDAMYYLGRCYQLTGDTEKATEYFNTIVNEYPEARLYSDAASRLREMGYQI
ncbi:MAG: tetratricopeptide repeat protein [Lachnospiraceae bacterium]|nr:tetratricopeptide repeat protein [Lachnospiraceae bacterium]